MTQGDLLHRFSLYIIDMLSPSQHMAHASQSKSRRKRKSKGGRHTSDAEDMPPSTPVSRFATRHHDAFSPFSFKSSQDSPKPEQPLSPSVIFFSGPSQRGFERVHDDTFPQNVQLLKNMARSKFKLPPSASVEMSYVNPDGAVCDLDDEHDLRALALHAAFSTKLKVNVASSVTPSESPLSLSHADTGAPKPFMNGSAAAEAPRPTNGVTPKDAPVTPKRHLPVPSTNGTPADLAAANTPNKAATAPATSATPQANGIPSEKTEAAKTQKKSPPKSASAHVTPLSAEAHANGKNRWEDREDAAALVARLFPNLASDAPSSVQEAALRTALEAPTSTETVAALSASQPAPPAVKKAAGKRKRADNSPPPPSASSAPQESTAATEPPSSPVGPAAKKPRGRPKKVLVSQDVPTAPTVSELPIDAVVPAAPAAEAAAAQVSAPVEARPAKSQTSAAPPAVANGVATQEQTVTETPKRGRVGRPKKVVPAPAAPSVVPESSPSQAEPVVPAAAPKPRGRPSKKALAEAEATPAEVPSASAAPENAPTQPEPAASKPRGRPPKKALAAAQTTPAVAADALSEVPTASEATEIAPSQPEPAAPAAASKPRGRPPKKALANVESTPAVATEASSEHLAPPAKKAARVSRATKASQAAAALVEPTSAVEATAPVVESPSAPAAEQLADQVMEDVNHTQASEAAPTSSAPSATNMSQEGKASEAAEAAEGGEATKAATGKRTAAAKPRATKAATARASKAAVDADKCVVCGETPNHEKENCRVWLGGSQAILDLLGMIRNKSRKSKQEKESTKILHQWLSQQFGAPQADLLHSQDSVLSSKDSAPAASIESNLAAVAPPAATQDSATDHAEPEPAVTTKKPTKAQLAAEKRQAKKDAAAAAETAAQLPPPSGVEASVAQTADPVPDSSQKPAPRAARGPTKKALAAAAAAAKSAVSAPQSSEPMIALTPSSPPHPSTSQSSEEATPGLRAPSESSEAELATSPMLSAAPRANDDMDVDPLPTQSQPSPAYSAAQQLEERKRRMKLADSAERSSSPSLDNESAAGARSRSRSASITSSDTSHGGRSSDDDSDADSDADVSKGRKALTKSAKANSSKAPRSPAAPAARARRGAANRAASASDSDSDSSSSDSETESEPEMSQSSTRTTSKVGEAMPHPTPQAQPARNPFMRGLTPLSTRQSNANGKPSSFTRLSDLKPASLRQNLSQPGSPSSTGGSTPLSSSGQNGFFSQPVANGVSAALAPTEEEAEKQPSESEEDDESDSSTDSSSSEDETGKSQAKKKTTAGKKAGAAAAAAKPARRKKDIFKLFG